MRVTFDTVKVRRTVQITDTNGKRRNRSKTFTHTINPFNKNADGSVKTEAQVYADINTEADAWVAEMKAQSVMRQRIKDANEAAYHGDIDGDFDY